MKIKLTDYIATHYIGRKPDRRTVKNQIKNGELPGGKEGGLWYVYLSAPADTSTGDSTADSILAEIASCR